MDGSLAGNYQGHLTSPKNWREKEQRMEKKKTEKKQKEKETTSCKRGKSEISAFARLAGTALTGKKR